MYTRKIYQTHAHYLYTAFQRVALCLLVLFHIPDGMNADALGMHALGMLAHGMLRKYARRRTEALGSPRVWLHPESAAVKKIQQRS